MPYKTILVALNNISRADALLSASTGLATQHEAHLIGLYVIPTPRVYAAYSAHSAPIVLDEAMKFFEQHHDESRQNFEAAAKRAGVEAEWRRVDADTAEHQRRGHRTRHAGRI